MIVASAANATQHAIVRLVLLDDRNSLGRLNLLRKFAYRCQCVARSARRPLEFPLQHAFNLFQYRLRDEHGDPTSSRQCEYLIGHSAEVEGRDVDIGVSDNPEHSATSSVLLHEPLDVRFLNSQLTRLGATKLLKFSPPTVRHVAPQSLP